jgi:hypothetical protein
MAFNSVGRLMGGGQSRRKGPRTKKAKNTKARPAVVKVKIKGTLKQVQNAAKQIAGEAPDVGQPPIGKGSEEQAKNSRLG